MLRSLLIRFNKKRSYFLIQFNLFLGKKYFTSLRKNPQKAKTRTEIVNLGKEAVKNIKDGFELVK